MPSNYTSLTITWYDESDSYVTTSDITADIKSIPLFTDTGTGEVNQASIIVRSLDGNYNTSGSVVFAEFDRIRIQVTDLGGNTAIIEYDVVTSVDSVEVGGVIIEAENKSNFCYGRYNPDTLEIEYRAEVDEIPQEREK